LAYLQTIYFIPAVVLATAGAAAGVMGVMVEVATSAAAIVIARVALATVRVTVVCGGDTHLSSAM
jgi:hypothetical protein